MGPFQIVITEPAEKDLNNIANYIAINLQNPSSARQLMHKFSEAISNLGKISRQYSLVRDKRLASSSMRYLFVNNYIVFYIVSDTLYSVTIIRILYNKRNWKSIL